MSARPGVQPWQAVALVFAILAVVAVRSALSSLSPSARGDAANARRRLNAAADGAAQASERAARAALGKQIFFDTNLSEPPGTSCGSCHDPARGYAGNNGSTIGVARGSRPDHFARRNTPSLLYLTFVRRFHFHWEEDAALPDAFGGFFWDGRADSLAALVEQPLSNPDEMNGGDRAHVAAKLRASAYAGELQRRFGAGVLDSPDEAMQALGQAVEAFLLSDELAPFSSRYDDFIRGRAVLTAEEQRGMQLFRDPGKGNCGSCHKLNPSSPNPARSPFTDFGFEAVAVPRNNQIPSNHDPAHADLGLCAALPGHPHSDEPRFCGSFRTPSLRNVATRSRFMHNGYFSRLRDVVAFYATRSIEPARWYPSRIAYDDVPPLYRQNVNELTPPYDRGPGEKPRLDDGEIDAIVAFLGTLTDAGLKPAATAAPVTAAPPARPPATRPPNATGPRRDIRTLANQPQLQPQE